MKNQSSVAKVVKALLVHFQNDACETSYPLLPPSLAPLVAETVENHAPYNNAWVKKIHYSWYLSFFTPLPKDAKALFLTLFPPEDKKSLEELLATPSFSKPLSPLAQDYLATFLFQKMEFADHLPPEYYTTYDLYPLLTLSKKELLFLIDLLGIYDLAQEVQKIVDKTLLNKIHAALSSDELNLLQLALKQQMRFPSPPLNLTQWDGDKKKLKALLHARGLHRLGIACAEEEGGFQWHLIHSLDTGRGEALTKLFHGKGDPAMIAYFKGQVLGMLKRMVR